MRLQPTPRPTGRWAMVAIAAATFIVDGILLADGNHPAAAPPPPPDTYPKIDPAKKAATPEARHVPPQIEALQAKRNQAAPMDEPLGGFTRRGTPVSYRTDDCFPAETRDLFWQMDQVASGPGGQLQPLNFDKDGDGKIDDRERNAIRGRNTWVLWGGGNESFWGWLTEDGYGLSDFLIMLDSRQRWQRFRQMGAMNQPGFVSNADPQKRILGLYFDVAGPGGRNRLTPPPSDAGVRPVPFPANPGHQGAVRIPPQNDSYVERVVASQSTLFQPGDVELFRDTVRKLAENGDGVDYTVYGFPSGVIGLRLMLNPDFFGVGEAALQARRYWKERVIDTNDRYYTDPTLNADRHLVRPFRVSMSCGYCHVGPHPLNPPVDPNNPEWQNLSNIIGNQYWKPQPCIGNLPKAYSILHQFLASQAPGTVDTSGFSPDQLNNANTINGVFQINARLDRARQNPREKQSIDNLRLQNLEEGLPAVLDATGPEDRRTARVLLDGSDSIGAFGALARVYLNIGTFSEYWNTRTNPLIGFTKHKVFDLKTCQSNSVYWMTNERDRAAYLAEFFTFQRGATTAPPQGEQSATGPMKLRDAVLPNGARPPESWAGNSTQRIAGRKVWANNCAICHSSKQPEGFELLFERKPKWNTAETTTDWTRSPKPAANSAAYTLPMDEVNWTAFKNSEAYRDYLGKLHTLVEAEGKKANITLDNSDPWDRDHPFWENNYLSTDIRVPVTLVGTNAARTLGTNAIRGNVWDNLSSDTYKDLPATGDILYWDMFRSTYSKFKAPAGGVGYYRPNTHVGLWATAPFLHNNSLGFFTEDPSVEGRLAAFEDSIRRVLWVQKRSSPDFHFPARADASYPDLAAKYAGRENRRPGDLRRRDGAGPAAGDPGYIYRLPNAAYVHFEPSFVRPLVQGVAGPFITSLLTFWGWLVLFIGLLWIYMRFQVRHAGVLFLLLATLAILLLTTTGMTGGGTTLGALLAAITTLLELSSTSWFIFCAALAVLALLLLFTPESEVTPGVPDHPATARMVIAIAVASVLLSLWLGGASWGWLVLVLVLGGLLAWWWRLGLQSLLRHAIILPLILLTAAGGWTSNRFINGKKILHVPVANIDIGPLPVVAGPFPRGMPLNLLLNADPDSKNLGRGLASLFAALAKIKQQGLEGEAAYAVIKAEAGEALLQASKCPDFVLDRGHLFGEQLTDEAGRPLSAEDNEKAKEALISFLKTL